MNLIQASLGLFSTNGSATRQMWKVKQTGLSFGETLHLATKIYLNRELTRAGMTSQNQLKSMFRSFYSTVLLICTIPHHSLVFRWLAIPWLQSELDKWIIMCNRSASWSNTKKVLPHGIPELMWQKPEQYDIVNFEVWSSQPPQYLRVKFYC